MFPDLPLEDEFQDVVSKAARGRGQSIDEITRSLGFATRDLGSFFDQAVTEETVVRELAAELGLKADALFELAATPSIPKVCLPSGVHWFDTPAPVPGYQEMRVNSFLAVSRSGPCCAIDTGTNANALRGVLESLDLRLDRLVLTHTHWDHVSAFDDLVEEPTIAFSPVDEPFRRCQPIAHGDTFQVGELTIRALRTSGHSAGGTTYVLEGLERPIAFVGDAVFCRSMGKATGLLNQAITEIRDHVLTLPQEAIICPGHGPLTTVEFESKHNPFFI